MTAMSRDECGVPGVHLQSRAVTEQEERVALEQGYPFVLFLVKPAAGRSRMAVGYDPLDNDLAASYEDLAELLGVREFSGNREEAFH